jgi:hypothetical protein
MKMILALGFGTLVWISNTASAQTDQVFLPPAPEGTKWKLAWHD